MTVSLIFDHEWSDTRLLLKLGVRCIDSKSNFWSWVIWHQISAKTGREIHIGIDRQIEWETDDEWQFSGVHLTSSHALNQCSTIFPSYNSMEDRSCMHLTDISWDQLSCEWIKVTPQGHQTYYSEGNKNFVSVNN